MTIKTFLFYTFFLLLFQLHAETISSTNFSINDGLPSNSIRAIYKDSRGLLWIGTDNGLCSYDGVRFKVYNEIINLNNNAIWSIVEDAQHNIWFAIYGKGIVKYDGKNFTYYDKKSGLSNTRIRRMYFSKKHQCLIIGTENGLFVYANSTFQSFSITNLAKPFQVMSINEWGDKVLISTRYNGVHALTFPTANSPIARLDSFLKTEFCYSGFVDENLYFGGSVEEHFFTKNLINNKETTFSSPFIWDFAKTESHIVYTACWDVATISGGLFKYSNGHYQDVSKQANISSSVLWCLFYDKETKTLWAGSLDKGLYKVVLRQEIEAYDANFFGLDKLAITSLFNDKENNLWIGADNFIIKKHPDNTFEKIDKKILYQKINLYFLKHKKISTLQLSLSQGEISNGFITLNFIQDPQKNIWVGTSWGLFCLDQNLNVQNNLPSAGCYVAIDHKQTLYAAEMYNGVSIYKYPYPDKPFIYLAPEDINTPINVVCALNNKNKIWFGSYTKGLYRCDDGHFKHFNFPENHIKGIALDKDNNLLIGTNNGNVILGKEIGDSIYILKQYLPERQIKGNSVSFVQVMQDQYLIGTNKGLNVLKNDALVAYLNQTEGLPTLPYLSSEMDRDGNLYIANDDGVYKFNSHFFNFLSTQPKAEIVVDAVKVNGAKWRDSLFCWNNYNNSCIQLTYQQNDVELSFLQNNIFNSEKNIYRYKIIGLSDQWSEYESNGNIHLRAIPNGKYQIVLEGKNTGTGEVFITRKIQLIITPPFWKTPWFITLCLLLILATILGILKLRIISVQKREQEKAELTNKLLESRLIALRAQMNPHFMFNAMNSIQNFIIDKDTHLALHYLSEFSKLIRQTLDNSTEKLIPLATEIDFLNSYIAVQKMRFDSIQTMVTVDQSIDKYSLFISTLIIQPFIENAFEHAFDNSSASKKIEVAFIQQDALLICTIADNGKGFSENDAHLLYESKGIKLCKDRILLLNREYKSNKFTLNITSSNKGTVVVLTFPILHKVD
jgi:ligand-binding sensor domain-containing protein